MADVCYRRNNGNCNCMDGPPRFEIPRPDFFATTTPGLTTFTTITNMTVDVGSSTTQTIPTSTLSPSPKTEPPKTEPMETEPMGTEPTGGEPPSGGEKTILIATCSCAGFLLLVIIGYLIYKRNRKSNCIAGTDQEGDNSEDCTTGIMKDGVDNVVLGGGKVSGAAVDGKGEPAFFGDSGAGPVDYPEDKQPTKSTEHENNYTGDPATALPTSVKTAPIIQTTDL